MGTRGPYAIRSSAGRQRPEYDDRHVLAARDLHVQGDRQDSGNASTTIEREAACRAGWAQPVRAAAAGTVLERGQRSDSHQLHHRACLFTVEVSGSLIMQV